MGCFSIVNLKLLLLAVFPGETLCNYKKCFTKKYTVKHDGKPA